MRGRGFGKAVSLVWVSTVDSRIKVHVTMYHPLTQIHLLGSCSLGEV